VFLILGSPATAADAPKGVCKALRNLISAAADAKLVEVSFSNDVQADGNDLAFSSCRSPDSVAAIEFCREVATASGMHGLQNFPVWIAECLRASHATALRAEHVKSGPWAPMIRSVQANVGQGLRLQVQYRPRDGKDDARPLDIYGTYDLTIDRP
jgi:hypothetical protein